jgi:hypothetical protein
MDGDSLRAYQWFIPPVGGRPENGYKKRAAPEGEARHDLTGNPPHLATTFPED